MDQNLRELFERALDDEPVPPAGDLAAVAMADGVRLRRRRTLGLSGVAGGLAVALAAMVVLNASAPDPGTVQEAAVAGPRTVCVPAEKSAGYVSIFLNTDIGDGQRAALDQYLQTSPDVSTYSFESREKAFARFKTLWKDDPDFIKSVGPDSLPESFRIELSEPAHYPALLAELKKDPGVQDVVGLSCPPGVTPETQR